MQQVDWTQVLLAAITMLGTVLSAIFSARARSHSNTANAYSRIASVSADRAEASLRPPPGES